MGVRVVHVLVLVGELVCACACVCETVFVCVWERWVNIALDFGTYRNNITIIVVAFLQ